MQVERPTVADALPLARAIFARNAGGCCLHIVLADKNLERRDVVGCLGRALALGHDDCEPLARMLLEMTASQRGRVARRAMRP